MAGTTSQSLGVFIQDSSSTVGAGLTGLVFNSGSLTAYYVFPGGNSNAITLATLAAANSSWATGGFKEIDSTNMKGWYRFDIPNAAIASGNGRSVCVHFQGATNMAPLPLEIELTGWDNQANITIDKGAALSAYSFPMYDSGTGLPRTGLTVTATRSLDGAAFASCTNSPAEVSNGLYKIDLSTTDTAGRVITLRFTATGALDFIDRIVTQGN